MESSKSPPPSVSGKLIQKFKNQCHVQFTGPTKFGCAKQDICDHFNNYILENKHFYCTHCGHTFDPQLFLLNVPWCVSCGLAEEYVREFHDTSIICKVMLNIPDNEPTELQMSFEDFEYCYRMIGMMCGIFYDFYTSDPLNDNGMNLFVLPVCYDLSSPANCQVLSSVRKNFLRLIDGHLKELKQKFPTSNNIPVDPLSESENDETNEQQILLHKLLEFTCEHVKSMQKNSTNENYIQYTNECLIPEIEILTKTKYERVRYDLASWDIDENGQRIPLRYLFQWYEAMMRALMSARNHWGRISLALDKEITLIPITTLW